MTKISLLSSKKLKKQNHETKLNPAILKQITGFYFINLQLKLPP